MILKINTYNLGVRDERERVRKLLKACLMDAQSGEADEDEGAGCCRIEIDEREERQIRSNAVQVSLEMILCVLDNWKPNK